jgi:hypothetical protein
VSRQSPNALLCGLIGIARSLGCTGRCGAAQGDVGRSRRRAAKRGPARRSARRRPPADGGRHRHAAGVAAGDPAQDLGACAAARACSGAQRRAAAAVAVVRGAAAALTARSGRQTAPMFHVAPCCADFPREVGALARAASAGLDARLANDATVFVILRANKSAEFQPAHPDWKEPLDAHCCPSSRWRA